jgi:YHS domain-containing protein
MIKKLLITLLSVIALSASAQTNKVGLAWDPICNTNVTAFIVYYGTNTLVTPVTIVEPAHVDDCGVSRPAETNIFKGQYNFTHIVNGYTSTNTVMTNLVKGVKYYFSISCRNAAGLESDRSNEIEYIVPLYSTNSVPSKVRGVRVIEIK